MLLLLAAAHAADNADIELVRPTLSGEVLPGTDRARLDPAGTVRVGLLLQYERDPLVLYQFQEEIGSVVSNRQTSHLAFAWQPAAGVAVRGSLPVVGQWGTEVPELGNDGVGVGDLALGARFAFVQKRNAALGASFDLGFPSGTRDMWVGDAGMRADAAGLADLDAGPFRLSGRLGTVLRAPHDTSYDLVVGSEVGATATLAYAAWPDRVSLQSGVVTRTSYTEFFQAGESVAEWLIGLETRPARDWNLGFGVGRGVAPGYGTSQFRTYAQLSWERRPAPPPPPEPKTTLAVAPTEDLSEEEVQEPPPEETPPPAKPVELAVLQEDQIVIRDPIQFEFGKDVILPESMPTLHAVAAIMAAHPEILHVTIEGHASEEGSYLYNYNLSLSRALAIYRALVEAGVHPSRLSCRAMGEVEPVKAGTDEQSLAANRRVIFHIVRRLQPGEAPPTYGTEVHIPWTGETRPYTQPPPPAPAPPPPAKPAEGDEEEDE